MKQFKRRIERLESAAGREDDNSFLAQAARAHARGETIRQIIVDPRKGETIESVCAREGLTDDTPCIVRTLVEPSGWRAETDTRLRALKRDEECDE